jgi:hypothetical protein
LEELEENIKDAYHLMMAEEEKPPVLRFKQMNWS